MTFRSPFRRPAAILAATLLLTVTAGCGAGSGEASQVLLNVSYDPTRELYEEVNARFAARWEDSTGQTLLVRQSHGGSGKQSRAVIDGLGADVVTLALAHDVHRIAGAGLLPKEWQRLLPHESVPFYSTIVFLVRRGNPKGIRDWDDLARPGVAVIAPNPKTSGGARWGYLAAWGYGALRFDGDTTRAEDLVRRIYANVPVLDAGARAATTTFVEREMGDVLIAWESEAQLVLDRRQPGEFEIVAPSWSVRADPPVAVVERSARRRGTLDAARAYLGYLYTPEAQEIAARHHYRPIDPAIARQHAQRFAPVKLFDVKQAFGGWDAAHARHFADGGAFDRMMEARR